MIRVENFVKKVSWVRMRKNPEPAPPNRVSSSYLWPLSRESIGGKNDPEAGKG